MADAPPLRLEWWEPSALEDNPANWRRHPAKQVAALGELIADVGWAGALLYNERTKRLIDGHARKGLSAPGKPVPVLVGSWSEEQERKILATLDPLAAMAETNREALARLLPGLEGGGAGVKGLTDLLAEQAQVAQKDVQLRTLDARPPPPFAWVLVGIPTVRFGEIAPLVEAVAKVEGVFCETTANDREPA
jgi:hypothetical protein